MKQGYIIALLAGLTILLAACSSGQQTTGAATGTEDRLSQLERLYSLDPARDYIGQKMDDIHFRDLVSDKTYHLEEDLAGKVVILETFSVGCPSCAEGIKNFNKLYDKYGDKIQIVYLGISETDTKESILNIKESYDGRDWIWTKYAGNLIPFYDQYNIYANEQTFIIGKDGTVVYADSFKFPFDKMDTEIAKWV